MKPITAKFDRLVEKSCLKNNQRTKAVTLQRITVLHDGRRHTK